MEWEGFAFAKKEEMTILLFIEFPRWNARLFFEM